MSSNRLKQLDRQILDLLAERLELAETAAEDDEDETDDEEEGSSDLEWWIEEGAERGIDDVTVEKIFKAITGAQGE